MKAKSVTRPLLSLVSFRERKSHHERSTWKHHHHLQCKGWAGAAICQSEDTRTEGHHGTPWLLPRWVSECCSPLILQ